MWLSEFHGGRWHVLRLGDLHWRVTPSIVDTTFPQARILFVPHCDPLCRGCAIEGWHHDDGRLPMDWTYPDEATRDAAWQALLADPLIFLAEIVLS